MKVFAIVLIVFGIIVIAYPEIIAYLLGGFIVFVGTNMLLFSLFIKKERKETFVKFGDYKIFR